MVWLYSEVLWTNLLSSCCGRVCSSETVKDLIRFLRYDTDECDIRRQLGEAEIVSRDLLPIIKQYHDDRVLFDTVIRYGSYQLSLFTCSLNLSIKENYFSPRSKDV